MGKNTDNNSLKKQIRESMFLKETEALIEIWDNDDHEEWSDDAFEVVQEILHERLGRVPTRKKRKSIVIPIQTSVSYAESKFIKYLSWAKTSSWIALGLYSLMFLSRLVWDIQNGGYGFPFNTSQMLTFLSALSIPITGVVFFLLLQVAAECGHMLIEMKNEK